MGWSVPTRLVHAVLAMAGLGVVLALVVPRGPRGAASAPPGARVEGAEGGAPPAWPLVRAETVRGGVRLVVRDDSGMAGPDRPVYLASSRNGWNPADPAQVLSPTEDGRWAIDVPHDAAETVFLYKFTLGGWERNETDAHGFSIRNRRLPWVDATRYENGGRATVESTAARFLTPEETENLGRGWQPRVSAGRIELVEVRGGAGRAAGLRRDLHVWLPPGYDSPANATRLYPVLYMLDGQNLFERHGGIEAEWGFDETVNSLLRQGRIEPFIVVGIPHAGRYSIDEHLPFALEPETARRMGPVGLEYVRSVPSGPAFVRWIVDEAMPAVSQRYRTLSGAADTAIGGGGWGATLAYYAASRRYDVFGKALAENLTAPQGPDGPYLPALLTGHPTPRVLYVGFGDLLRDPEGGVTGIVPRDVLAEDVAAVRSLMERSPRQADRLLVNYQPETGFDEAAWAKRLPRALEFLFPARR